MRVRLTGFVLLGVAALAGCGGPVPATPTGSAAHPACADAWTVLDAGLLAEADKRYRDLLNRSAGITPVPSPTPSAPPSAQLSPTPSGPTSAEPSAQPSTTPSAPGASASPSPSFAAAEVRACAAAGLAAVAQRRGEAARAVVDGDTALALGDLESAGRHYEHALRLDAANQRASTGLRTIELRRGGPLNDASAQIDDRRRIWAQPLFQVLIAIGLVGLVLAAAGRVVAGRVGPDARTREPRRWTYAFQMAGAALAVVAAVMFVLALALPVAAAAITAVGALGVAAAAVYLFGLGYGHRLALRLEVRNAKNETDAAATGYLLSRLATLGNEGPQGLRRSVGTDVTALETGAVAALPVNKVLQLLLRTAQSLLPTRPWQAQVTLVDNQTVTVELARNGRAAEPTLIDRRTLDTDPKEADSAACQRELLTAAAAAILLRMAKAHESLNYGLCGAQDWRSLACQVLASESPYADDPARADAMLARAVEDDPANRAAQLAYLHARAGRTVGTEDGERRRAHRLAELTRTLGSDAGYAALRMRVQYSLAAAWLNVRALARDQTAKTQAGHHARGSVGALMSEIVAACDGRDLKLRDFASKMQPVATLLDLHLREPGTGPLPDGAVPSSLAAHYTHAAVLLDRGRPAQALEHLELALGLQRYRFYARTDPSFTRLRTDPQFRRLVRADRSLAGWRTLGKNAGALAELGIRFATQLRRADAAKLAAALKIDEQMIIWWQGLCELAGLLDDQDVLSWVDLLVAEGIDSRAELARQNAETLGGQLVPRAVELGVPAPTLSDLTKWIDAARGHPSGTDSGGQ